MPGMFTSVRACLLVLCVAALPVRAACLDEPAVELQAQPVASARTGLQAIVREALSRSHSVGAAKLLAEAAQEDVEEARAASKPQAGLNASLGGSGSRSDGLPDATGSQLRGAVSASALLWDGGRSDRLVDWRSRLAEAARLGEVGAEEQVALQSVSLALDRARYGTQVLVYQQYARKMACLVQSLEQIVAADKGRASELVQARKTLQQAEISVQQAQSGVRQAEARLRRFVGPSLPAGEGLSAVLAQVPALSTVMAAAERSTDIAVLDAQADAAENYAAAVAAGQKPQLSWVVSGSKALGAGDPSAWSAGLALNVPLYNPAARPQLSAARLRAQAARQQRADQLDARLSRVQDVHEQASATFDRAQRISAVLQDSERVRESTLEQWQQLGRRSLFDVMAAEGEHYNLRIAYVNALYDGEQANALLWSLGGGLLAWLQ